MKQTENTWGDKNVPLPLVILVIGIIIGFLFFQMFRAYTGFKILMSMPPQSVTTFQIKYSGKSRILFKEFTTPDPIITDFFHALADLDSYSPSHDTVKLREHSWFMEISDGKTMIQLKCYIPYRENTIVAGSLFNRGGSGYCDFQSQRLFHWYQKYSHRWLEPEQNDTN